MRLTSRRLARALGLTLLFCAGFGVSCSAAAPPLVVIIVGDQIRADYLERYRSYLAPDGLRRFLERGTYFRNASQDYAMTKTSSGHVLIGSGLYPSQSGIIGNEWFDRTSSRTVSSAELIPGGDRVRLKWFAGTSFARRLHEKKPRSRVVSVSLKDRAALLLTGPDQDDAYWWDRKKEVFVNYKTTPAWLTSFNASIGIFFAQRPEWSSRVEPAAGLRREFEKQAAVTRGHIRNNDQLGPSFPHPLKSVKALMITPFSDDLIEQLAERITQEWNLGRNADNEPDVLTINFSAVDLVGHELGPDSMEVMDAFINLDRSVAKLMKFVEARTGQAVVWVFSSDHGVTSFPEVSKANGFKAGRVHIDTATLFYLGVVRAVSLPYVYLDDAAAARKNITKEKALRTVQDALQRIDGVEDVYSANQIASGAAPKEITKSFYVPNEGEPPRGGDLFIVLKPRFIFSDADDCGTTHGQPTDDDQHVPLGFYGFDVTAKINENPASVNVVAPTLLKKLGISAVDLTASADIFSKN